MILVDIYVPAVDDTFDFMLDETACIAQVKEEICKILSRRMKDAVCAQGSAFSLWEMKTGEMLEDGKTLCECRVTDGVRLIFV